MPLEIPQTFKHHIFMCFQDRPPGHPKGSCGQAGAKPLWDHLIARVDKLGRGDVGLTATGCLGFCRAGPLCVVYPEGIWYRPQTREDIDEIVTTHIVECTPVERLIIVPK
jgi:(2Fe-2S) ferredoxin